jgi:hypothetical protein
LRTYFYAWRVHAVLVRFDTHFHAVNERLLLLAQRQGIVARALFSAAVCVVCAPTAVTKPQRCWPGYQNLDASRMECDVIRYLHISQTTAMRGTARQQQPPAPKQRHPSPE